MDGIQVAVDSCLVASFFTFMRGLVRHEWRVYLVSLGCAVLADVLDTVKYYLEHDPFMVALNVVGTAVDAWIYLYLWDRYGGGGGRRKKLKKLLGEKSRALRSRLVRASRELGERVPGRVAAPA